VNAPRRTPVTSTWWAIKRIEDLRPGDSVVACGPVASVACDCDGSFEVAFESESAICFAAQDACGRPPRGRVTLVFDPGAGVAVLA
jgi:hypothetical protein